LRGLVAFGAQKPYGDRLTSVERDFAAADSDPLKVLARAERFGARRVRAPFSLAGLLRL